MLEENEETAKGFERGIDEGRNGSAVDGGLGTLSEKGRWAVGPLAKEAGPCR
jgi:hypothetical protein